MDTKKIQNEFIISKTAFENENEQEVFIFSVRPTGLSIITEYIDKYGDIIPKSCIVLKAHEVNVLKDYLTQILLGVQFPQP